MPILSNQIKCNKCGDVIYSAHVHDFKTCSCGAVSVDGGMDYLRRCGDWKDMEDMSILITDKLYKDLEHALEWCENTGRNYRGVICTIARVLRDHGLDWDTLNRRNSNAK